MRTGTSSNAMRISDAREAMRIHREWGSVRLELGPLWLIWCAPDRPNTPGHPNIPGHPNRWMIVWRRGLPEWNPGPPRRWKTLPAKLTEADRRDFGVERADEDEPDKVRLLQAFAPLACFQCDHPDAPKARKEIIEIIRAIRHREPLPRPPDIAGDLPVNCCRRPADKVTDSEFPLAGERAGGAVLQQNKETVT